MIDIKFFGKSVVSIGRSEAGVIATSVDSSAGVASEKRDSVVNDQTIQLANAMGFDLNKVFGIPVSQNTIWNLSAVWRAVDVLSSNIAMLPLHLYKRTETGKERVTNHQAAILIRRPNEYNSSFDFRKLAMINLVIWGNAYIYIQRSSSGKPIALHNIHPAEVEVNVIELRRFYTFSSSKLGIEKTTVSDFDMIHLMNMSVDGIKGRSVLSVARESLNLTYQSQKFGLDFYENGAQMSGVVSVDKPLSDQAFSRLKTQFDNRYTGIKNRQSTTILEGGMKYDRVSIPPNDAQFLETRKFQIPEIARWFGVPPHKLYDLERATFSNIEHQGIEYVTDSIMSHTQNWVEWLNLRLLTFAESANYYFHFELKKLMQADSQVRAEFYNKMFMAGVLSPKQIAELEEIESYEGSDRHYVQGAMIPTDKVDEFISKQNVTSQSNG